MQCKFARRAYGDLAADITNNVQPRDAFYGIQNFLFAAGNISKALWGEKPDNRKALRDSLSVDDSSPLRAVRMRDHYAHFDERLERWWKTSERRWFVDANFMRRDAIQNGALAEKDTMRNFDPETGDLIFWGDDFNVIAMSKEIKRILDRATQLTSKPAPWEAR
jgi:hypothetical protein